MTTPCTNEDRITAIEKAVAEIPHMQKEIESGFTDVKETLKAHMAALTRFRERVLGNGTEGIIDKLDRRMTEVEVTKDFETRVQREVAKRGGTPQPVTGAGIVKQAVKDTPPYAWFIIAMVIGAKLGPDGVAFVVEMARKLIGG